MRASGTTVMMDRFTQSLVVDVGLEEADSVVVGGVTVVDVGCPEEETLNVVERVVVVTCVPATRESLCAENSPASFPITMPFLS